MTGSEPANHPSLIVFESFAADCGNQRDGCRWSSRPGRAYTRKCGGLENTTGTDTECLPYPAVICLTG